MMFDHTIQVRENEFYPLRELSDRAIAPQLGITADDLSRMHLSIQEEARELGFYAEGCHITTNPLPRSCMGDSPYGRTVYSNNSNYQALRKSENRLVLAAKGSGFEDWLGKFNKVKSETRKSIRKYPIVILKKPTYSTTRVWGGETETMGSHQFIHGLILNVLIERHGLAQAVYKPIKLSGFRELPVEEDGRIRAIPLEDYCDSSFQPDDERSRKYFRIPCLDEAKNFAELFYYGDMLHLRVPPRQHVTYDVGGMVASRFPTAGSLSELIETEAEKMEVVRQFSEKLAGMVKTVHSYNGAFTILDRRKFDKGKQHSYHPPISSLFCGNVTMGGVVCDLDTLSFSLGNNEYTKIDQAEDCRLVSNTIRNFANLFEENIESGILADEAGRVFRDVYPDSCGLEV